jgi:hypothetical protein
MGTEAAVAVCELAVIVCVGCVIIIACLMVTINKQYTEVLKIQHIKAIGK